MAAATATGTIGWAQTGRGVEAASEDDSRLSTVLRTGFCTDLSTAIITRSVRASETGDNGDDVPEFVG